MLSGVTIVAVMTKPYNCPHGRCIYCPGGPEYGTPQSYIGKEPALMRAIHTNFDPYEQVRLRLWQYETIGHIPNKVEVIVMGGTFTAMPIEYQEWFVTNIYDAANRYPKPRGDSSPSLEEVQVSNETSNIRIVGLTIETKPDWCKEKHIDNLLRFGATKVELGVQSIYDDVLAIANRGHSVRDTIEATRLLKDAGYKVVYHIMPGLPGSDLDRDLEMMKELFDNPDYRPDMLKIYPTLVVPGTGLYGLWRSGRYKALSDEEAIELVSEFYRYIPKWVRIMNMQRDIPADLIAAGPRRTNLRQLAEKRALEKGIEIKEIRFREVGRRLPDRDIDPGKIEITKEYYEASGGIEVFIAAEERENSILIGLLRLRIPSGMGHRPEIDDRTALIRELHIYGPQIPVGQHHRSGWQHQGWGSKLLKTAEEIARHEFSSREIYVLSGVGVREYYRRHGYRRIPGTPYLAKSLSNA